MTVVTVFNADFVEPKKPLNSLKFWRKFNEARVEGYSKFIHFFEPHLTALTSELKDFNEPAEAGWVQSIQEEIARERCLLTLMKESRRAYGDMGVNLKEHESSMKNKGDEIDSMRNELKSLRDEYNKIHETYIKDKEKLESEMTKFENILYSSSKKDSDLKEKGKKLIKLGEKYDTHKEHYEIKTECLLQKSKQLIEKFTERETLKVDILLYNWCRSLRIMSKNYSKFVQTARHLRDGTEAATRVYKQDIVAIEKMNREQKLRIHNFRSSTKMFNENLTIKEYFETQEKEKDEDHAEEEGSSKEQKSNKKKDKKKDKKKNKDKKKSKQANNNDSDSAHDSDSESRDENIEKPKGKKKIVKSGKKSRIESRPLSNSSQDTESSSDKDQTSKPGSSTTERRNLPQPPTKCWGEKTASSTSRPRPLPMPPMSCWQDGSSNNDEKQGEEPFRPFKVKVKRGHKKEENTEMSVRKGDNIEVLNRPVNGFVLAKKTSRLMQSKEGLVPIWAI